MPEGYFDDTSILRRVVGERAVALSGPRALLMQAAHPLAVAGLLAHTTGLDDPYDRLSRTARVMEAVSFGSRLEADRATSPVREAHRRVRGRLERDAGPFPAGTPYRADDPALLLWVLYTLVDSVTVVYDKYVARLPASEREALWADYRQVGRLFGLREEDMPAGAAELREYGRERLASGELIVTDWARTRARSIVLEPPAPLRLRPVVEAMNFITASLLPPEIRRQYGFLPLPPQPVRAAIVAAGAEYVRRVVLPVLPPQVRRVPASRTA